MTDTATVPGHRLLPALLEVAAALGALWALAALLVNKVDTRIALFGETPTVTDANVSTYHLWLLVLIVSIALSFVGAAWRRSPSGRSTYWHGLVLVAGLVAATAFHVSR